MSELQISINDFVQLREQNCVYVDKTAMIAQLAKMPSKMIFMARPRRFGKTLLVSTFESLFADGLKHFSGLEIEKLWDDQTYPVVRLDFSLIRNFENKESFVRNFQALLSAEFSKVGFVGDSDSPMVLGNLSQWLMSRPKSSIVLLIDEYDWALTNTIDDKEKFSTVRTCLADFFSLLKGTRGVLRFFFMTGITKFQNTRFFSNFNNLQDISLDPKYGTLLGYTEEELVDYFASHLDNACRVLGIDNRDELIKQMREMYDGFCFDELAQTHVYVPWSVQSFLTSPERGFKNYWYETGGQPALLMKFLKSNHLDNPQSYGNPIWMDLESYSISQDYDVISPVALLSQVGYLSIKEVSGGNVLLGYPNKEVSMSMARLYARNCFGDKIPGGTTDRLCSAMKLGNISEVLGLFNQTFAALDYKDYPIHNEAECRALIQVYLLGASLNPAIEVHNAWGRSDLEVHLADNVWVFEFKYVENTAQAQKALQLAVHQIEKKRYGSQSLNKKLLRVAVVYSAEDRSIVLSKRIDDHVSEIV